MKNDIFVHGLIARCDASESRSFNNADDLKNYFQASQRQICGVDNVKNKQAVELLTEFKPRGITWEIKNGFVLFDAAKLNTSDNTKLAGFKNEQLISAAENLK